MLQQLLSTSLSEVGVPEVLQDTSNTPQGRYYDYGDGHDFACLALSPVVLVEGGATGCVCDSLTLLVSEPGVGGACGSLTLPVSEPGVGPVCGSLALPVSESGVGCASPVYCRQAVTPSLALSHCCGVRHQLGNSYAGWSLPLIFPCVDCMYS